MALIAVLISLLAERLVPRLQEIRELEWFAAYGRWVLGRAPAWLSKGGWGVALVLAGPLVLIWGLHWLVEGWLFGFPELFLAIAVLFFSLRLGGLDESVDAYVEARDQGLDQDARHHAQNVIPEPMPADADGELRAFAENVLYQSLERVFAVIFWFALLGPLGAALYRLAAEMRDRLAPGNPPLETALSKLIGFLDWAPARLMTLAFLLTGSFEEGIEAWRRAGEPEERKPLEAENRDLVRRVGCGALRLPEHMMTEAQREAAEAGPDTDTIRSARGIILRSLVIWLAVIALLTLGGWLA